jgi:hypothetical protein
MDGLNKTNKISGEMNDSNKDQDSEEPVEKIVVDLETEETKEETNVQEEVLTIDSIKMKKKGKRRKTIWCLLCGISKNKEVIEDSRLEESTDSAANRNEAEKGTTQEKRSIGKKQGKNINQENMSFETSL